MVNHGTAYYTSYVVLIGGFLLIIGLFRKQVLFLLSLVVTVVVVVIARIRHRIAFTGFSRLGIPRGDFSITRERSERSTTPSPVKQFLVVVLPDGTIVIPKVEGCSGPVTL